MLALIYKAAAALCEIVSDKKYADVLESASGSLMLMAGISGVISIMFIIIIGIIGRYRKCRVGNRFVKRR